jgi:branched-chain amino acid transport system permease protein
MKKYIYLAILVIVLLVLPFLFQSRYTHHILNMILIYALLGISVNLIFGYIGALTLGQAAFFGIGAYTAAIVSTKLGFSFLPSVLCSAVMGCLAGVIIGIPTLRLKGPYFAIATIGLNNIIVIIFLNWENLTGGAVGISGIPYASILGVQFNTELKIYFLLLATVFLIFLLYRNMISSHSGKMLIAVRDNELAASAMGIDTAKTKVIVLAISTTIAAVAGAYYAHITNFVAPDAFPVMESITFLIIVVLGGAGFKYGPIYGAVVVVILNEYLQYFEQFNMLIYGVLIMILLLFLPSGIAGIIEIVKAKYYEKKKMYYLKEVGIDEMK